MSRGNRLALVVAAAVILAVTGTVLATRAPEVDDAPAQQTQDGEDAPPTAEDIAHAVERLGASDLDVEPSLLTELTAEYGLGGAVRIVAWSAENDLDATMAEIREMRDGDGTEGSRMGWGSIAKKLGVHPGIGSIMGNGGGHGHVSAPGQEKDRGGGEGDASGG